MHIRINRSRLRCERFAEFLPLAYADTIIGALGLEDTRKTN
jgi:hypothetical protein